MKTPELRGSLRLPHAVYTQTGRIFSVTIGTRDRDAVFDDRSFGEECIRILRRLRTERGNPIYAYCLMPDHVHLLAGVHGASSLIGLVGAWKSLCARAYWRFGGRGTPWQESFYDRALRREEDLRRAVLYILKNPVREGLVTDYREWPLSGSFEWDLSDLREDQD
jgi:REP element-mobilizing transposase RayT